MHRLPDPTPPDAFLQEHLHIDGHEFFTVESPAFEVECSPTGYETHIKVVAPINGAVVLRQDHREIEVCAGSFACLDLARAFQMSSTSGRLFQWRVPKDILTRRHPELDWRTEQAIGSKNSGEQWVGHLLLGLASALPLMKSREQRVAINSLVEAMGLVPRLKGDHVEQRRVSRAMSELRRDLRQSDLEPTTLAASQGVSRRYLDSLMRKHTGRTLAETIRHERLQGAASDLRGHPEKSTLQVALSWGFENASHFARIFRKDFGFTPSSYRSSTGSKAAQSNTGQRAGS